MTIPEHIRLLCGAARPFIVGKLLEKIRGTPRVVTDFGDIDPRVALEFTRKHEWYTGVSCNQIADFMGQHPPSDTAMWAVGMDVGIRLQNMVAGLCAHADRRWISNQDCQQAIRHHVSWIDKHLEFSGGMATSHLLGGLLGMIAAGSVTDEAQIKEKGLWAAREFVQHIRRQILPDGMSFEASTAYHRHVADIMVHATRWMMNCERMKTIADAEYRYTLEKTVQALAVLEAAGMPLIGDNDDGMAVKVNPEYPGTPSTAELYRVYTQECGFTLPKPPAVSSYTEYSDFGLSIWFKPRYTLTARCGPLGQYNKGGHAHNDQNSITLLADGVPFITDSGSYVYTYDPDRRNADRSTQAHSTVVSDREQRSWPGGADGLFWMFNTRPAPFVERSSSTEWIGSVIHQNKKGYKHTRIIRLVSDTEILIRDEFDGTDSAAYMNLILHPGVTLSVINGGAVLEHLGRTVRCAWNGSEATTRECSIAPAYHVTCKTVRITVPLQGNHLDWSIYLQT